MLGLGLEPPRSSSHYGYVATEAKPPRISITCTTAQHEEVRRGGSQKKIHRDVRVMVRVRFWIVLIKVSYDQN